MKKSTVIRVAAIILGVIVIPLAYSLLYLSAFNDPYSKLNTLPIAVVNKDKGASIDGAERNIGDEIVDKLKENSQLGWQFTDEQDAQSGVKDTKYYAAITIPESFSKDIASAEDTSKTASTITYTMNEKRNYIGGQIISRAMLVLQQEVVSDVNKELTVELTKKFNEVPDKMNELNDGLGKLQDGTQQLADGTGTLKDNSVALVNGVSSLDKGIAEIASGSGSLNDGLSIYKANFTTMVSQESELNGAAKKLPLLVAGINSVGQGVNDIDSGAGTLAQGAGSLAQGAGTLDQGVNSLALGINTLDQGAGSLALGTYKLSQGAITLAQGADSLDQGILKCFGGSKVLSDGLTQYSANFGKFALGQKTLADTVNKNLPVLIGGIQNFNNSVNTITVTDPTTKQSYTTNFANITAQYVDGVGQMQTSYTTLLAGLQDCAATTDPAQFQQKFTAIMQNLQKNQDAMKTQSQQLQTAGQQIKDGSKGICEGASSLNASTSQLKALQDSINQLEAATEQLQAATAALQSGSDDLTSGLSQAKTGADALKAGADSVNSGADSVNSGAGSLKTGADSAKTGADKVKAGADALKSGADSVGSGTNALKSGADALKSGTDTLGSQSQALTTGDKNMMDSIAQLTDALNQFSQAVDKLSSGSQSLNNGIGQEKDGLSQLNGQVPSLQDGINKLNDGANQVNDGTKTAKDGVQSSITDSNTQLDKLNGLDEYSASPVSLDEEKTEAVPNYGTAFAPYFMSLSLWVGALIMFFGIYLDPDKRMPLLSRSSDRKLVRIAGFSAIGLAQAVLLAILVKWVLNLQVNNLVSYYLACILISMVFISMVQFFIVHLGDVGKLLGILMLIFQLTSCGGTFPMETVPKLFNVLYPFMPMTYSVNILKETISGHSMSIIVHNALVLIGIGVVFTVLTIIFSVVKKTKNMDSKNKSVTA